MADNPINMFDPWGADPEGGGGGATSAPSSESSSSPSSNSSDGSSGSSSGGKSGGESKKGGGSTKGGDIGFGNDVGFASGWGKFNFPLQYPELNVIDYYPDGYALSIFKGLTQPIATGIEVGFNALWDHNYIENSVENTSQAIVALYNEPELALTIIENVYIDFRDASGPDKARSLSSLASGIAISFAIPNFGGMSELKLFSKVENVSVKTGLTNFQLVQKAANIAEREVGGIGRFAGIEKHKFATDLLERYQKIYGSRGLKFGVSFNNGVGNRGILDILDETNGIIYDWKFGYTNRSIQQLNMTPQMIKYRTNFGLPTQIIKPE